jgi:hypothetical protein
MELRRTAPILETESSRKQEGPKAPTARRGGGEAAAEGKGGLKK